MLQGAPLCRTPTRQDLVESAKQKQYKSVELEYLYCILKICSQGLPRYTVTCYDCSREHLPAGF